MAAPDRLRRLRRTLLLSFLASTILHFFLLFGRYLRVLGILDHCAIYLLIAGTYTPFCLTLFAGPLGWFLFGLVWSLAAFWIVLKAVFFTRMPTLVSNLSYVSLGWIVVFFFAPVYNKLGPGAIGLMVAAGLCYTIGWRASPAAGPTPSRPTSAPTRSGDTAVLIGGAIFFCVMLFYLLPYNV